jgi:hypothetical protein
MTQKTLETKEKDKKGGHATNKTCIQKAIDQQRKNAPHMTHKTQRIEKTPIYDTKFTYRTKDAHMT